MPCSESRDTITVATMLSLSHKTVSYALAAPILVGIELRVAVAQL